LAEVSGPVEIDSIDAVSVGLDDAIQAIAFWVEDVAIEGETVRGTVVNWGDLGSEAERWD
jgi:hypothetical protein